MCFVLSSKQAELYIRQNHFDFYLFPRFENIILKKDMKCRSGKNSYSTKSLAETALIDIHIYRNFPPDQGPQNVYKCDYCGEWHFTSKSQKRNRRLQEMIDSGELKRMQRARQWE